MDKTFIRVLLRVSALAAVAGACLGTAWREIEDNLGPITLRREWSDELPEELPVLQPDFVVIDEAAVTE